MNIKKNWWKILTILLLTYTLIGGFFLPIPHLPIIEQSIRNLYFHVCMWMVMMICLSVSVYYATKFLLKNNLLYDAYSAAFAEVGFIFGLLGLITGAIWAKYTWGEAWSNDPKQLGAAIALLIYAAYLVLRQSAEKKQKPKISAVYNIFAYAMLFPTIWVLPRLVDSLHPGGTGNPALDTRDVDYRMRIVFYPAIIGWSLLAVWIALLKIKTLLKKTH